VEIDMTPHLNACSIAALVIVLGCLAAFAAALVPVYPGIYEVNALALAALLTPFAIYGTFFTRLRGPWLVVTGLILLTVTLPTVLDERYLHYDGYRDGTLYWLPLSTAAVLMLVAYVFGRRPPYQE
jgi:hypothetical protein